MDWMVKLGWGFVALSALILIASFSGDGTGPFGQGSMRSLVWSYVLIILTASWVLWMFPGRLRKKAVRA